MEPLSFSAIEREHALYQFEREIQGDNFWATVMARDEVDFAPSELQTLEDLIAAVSLEAPDIHDIRTHPSVGRTWNWAAGEVRMFHRMLRDQTINDPRTYFRHLATFLVRRLQDLWYTSNWHARTKYEYFSHTDWRNVVSALVSGFRLRLATDMLAGRVEWAPEMDSHMAWFILGTNAAIRTRAQALSAEPFSHLRDDSDFSWDRTTVPDRSRAVGRALLRAIPADTWDAHFHPDTRWAFQEGREEDRNAIDHGPQAVYTSARAAAAFRHQAFEGNFGRCGTVLASIGNGVGKSADIRRCGPNLHRFPHVEHPTILG